MRKKTIITIAFMLSAAAFLMTCTSARKGSDSGNMPSSSLEDYVLFEEKNKNLSYKLVSYAPMEQWFREEAKGKSADEIVALYEQLPLIRDLDSYDRYPSEERKKYILEISQIIIENGEKYKKMNSDFHDTAVPAMIETFQFFSQLLPEKEMNIVLILNPFFSNGGMGQLIPKTNETDLGRLEIGIARLSGTGGLNLEVFVAHEFVHIVHQYLGAADIVEVADHSLLTENLPLFTEGMATYYSAVIMDKEGDYPSVFFYDSYRSGPIRNPDFVQKVAQKYLDNAAGKPISNELHLAWFGSRSKPENRPFEQYQAIGYFLGYHTVKSLLDSGQYTMKTLLEQPSMTMQEEMSTAVLALLNNTAK